MLKDELEKVLEGLINLSCYEYSQKLADDEELRPIYPYEEHKKFNISQALTRILELVDKCVPEEKDFGNTFINKFLLDKYTPKEIYSAGFNQALAETKQKIGRFS